MSTTFRSQVLALPVVTCMALGMVGASSNAFAQTSSPPTISPPPTTTMSPPDSSSDCSEPSTSANTALSAAESEINMEAAMEGTNSPPAPPGTVTLPFSWSCTGNPKPNPPVAGKGFTCSVNCTYNPGGATTTTTLSWTVGKGRANCVVGTCNGQALAIQKDRNDNKIPPPPVLLMSPPPPVSPMSPPM